MARRGSTIRAFGPAIANALRERVTILPFHERWIVEAFSGGILMALLSCPIGSTKAWIAGQLAALLITPGYPMWQAIRESLRRGRCFKRWAVHRVRLRATLGWHKRPTRLPAGMVDNVGSSQLLEAKNGEAEMNETYHTVLTGAVAGVFAAIALRLMDRYVLDWWERTKQVKAMRRLTEETRTKILDSAKDDFPANIGDSDCFRGKTVEAANTASSGTSYRGFLTGRTPSCHSIRKKSLRTYCSG